MLDSIETQVFSLIKAKFSTKIKVKYKDLNFTTSDRSSTKPKFPTVYIHLLESPEIGSDLDGTSVNGINATFQIDVTDNQSQTRADEVAKEILKVMKSMRFKSVGMPFHDNSGDTYRTVGRYRRPIGAGDIL